MTVMFLKKKFFVHFMTEVKEKFVKLEMICQKLETVLKQNIKKSYINFIESFLVMNHIKRSTVKETLNHSWLWDVDADDIDWVSSSCQWWYKYCALSPEQMPSCLSCSAQFQCVIQLTLPSLSDLKLAIQLACISSWIFWLSPSQYFWSCLSHCLAGNNGFLFHLISLWRTSRHCLVTAYLNPVNLSLCRPRIFRNGHTPGEPRSK